jgi:apolipoprotein N-acyltransferase
VSNTQSSLISRLLSLRPGWLLLLSAMLLLFANGRWSIALVAWIAPIFLLRYSRLSKRPILGFFAAWGVMILVRGISWLGLIPFPIPIFVVTTIIFAAILVLPFWVDRLLVRRLPNSVATLVFPAAAVSADFLVYLQSDTTWGAIAYTQAASLPILQFASVFGLWGIAFLIYWTAPVANALWDRAASKKGPIRGAYVYAAVMIAVLIFGGVRLIDGDEDAPQVRVAVVHPPELMEILTPPQLALFQRYFLKLDVDPKKLEPVLEIIRGSNRELLSRAYEAAARGAEIIVWPEGGLLAMGEQEGQSLLTEAKNLARDSELLLGFAVGDLRQAPDEWHENKVLWLAPGGEVIGEYHKTQLVPYVETPVVRKGSGAVLVTETGTTRIGTAICYDMDNPDFLADAGQQEVEILFAPSSDWPAIATLHHRMAAFRAVEQGFHLVRPANHGLSAIVDWRGRVLASLRHTTDEKYLMEMSVPTGSVNTLYSKLGNALPWCCIGFVLLLPFAAVLRRRRDDGR